MGANLSLDAHEFDALDMLSSGEGRVLRFEELYSAIWDTGDGSCRRSAARKSLENLAAKINKAGNKFMWIEVSEAVCSGEMEYTFKTHWGHNWQSRTGESLARHESVKRPKSVKAWRGRRGVLLFTGVSVMVAAFVLSSSVNIGRSDLGDTGGFVYIFDDPVPLGVMPTLGAHIEFPSVGDVTVTAGADSMELEIFAASGTPDGLAFEIVLAGTGQILSPELFVSGTLVETVQIDPLAPGLHQDTLHITAIRVDSGEVVAYTSINFSIYAQ